MKTSQIRKLMQDYPTIQDLQKLSKKRLPNFAYSYLETGTGDEKGVSRNLERMADITLIPRL